MWMLSQKLLQLEDIFNYNGIQIMDVDLMYVIMNWIMLWVYITIPYA